MLRRQSHHAKNNPGWREPPWGLLLLLNYKRCKYLTILPRSGRRGLLREHLHRRLDKCHRSWCRFRI